MSSDSGSLQRVTAESATFSLWCNVLGFPLIIRAVPRGGTSRNLHPIRYRNRCDFSQRTAQWTTSGRSNRDRRRRHSPDCGPMRRLSRRLRATAFVLGCVLMALFSSARAADPQAYRVDLASVGNDEIDVTLKFTSDLSSLRSSAPVSPFGLIGRARSDVDRLTTVLESFGYYECRIVIKINGMLLNDPGLGDALVAVPKGRDALVAITPMLGTLYTLRHIDIQGELPDSI